MCHKTTCSRCKKPTWSGCGRHIETCLKDVPIENRCKCERDSMQQCWTNFISSVCTYCCCCLPCSKPEKNDYENVPKYS